MLFAIDRSVARFVIGGTVIAMLLSGCSGDTPPPAIPTSVEEVEQEAKELGQGIAGLGRDAARKFNEILAEEVPNLGAHFDNLRAESNSLYCTAKAKSAEAAAAVKAELEKVWSEQLTRHPDYNGPKLDLDGAACE